MRCPPSKGWEEGAVEEIVAERTRNGAYASVFDLTKRVNLRSVTKKVLEYLCKAGALRVLPTSTAPNTFLNHPANHRCWTAC